MQGCSRPGAHEYSSIRWSELWTMGSAERGRKALPVVVAQDKTHCRSALALRGGLGDGGPDEGMCDASGLGSTLVPQPSLIVDKPPSSVSISRVGEADTACASPFAKELAMALPTKPLSLSDIHDIYGGSAKKPDAAGAKPSYRKTDRFARDAGHSGSASSRPPSSTGRRAR